VLNEKTQDGLSPRPIRNQYNIYEVLKLRDRLVEVLQFEYGGKLIQGADFDRLLCLIRETLPIVDFKGMDALADSVQHLAGRILDRETLVETCHRLAGNLPRLVNRKSIVPWHNQRFFEWVPVQITGARLERRNKDVGTTFTLRILAGTPAPMIVLLWWSLRRCRFYSAEFGFTRQRSSKLSASESKYTYADSRQLVTLRFLGLVDPEKSTREPVITSVEVPRSGPVSIWNREQLKRRFRVDEGYTCPMKFPVTFPCHLCIKGYLSCPAGTHRHDYKVRLCPVCKRPDALWDPDVPANKCVDCVGDEAFNRKRL
jgi:hypothetical protein